MSDVVQEAQVGFFCKARYYSAKSTNMLWYEKMESDEPLSARGSDCSPVFGQYRSDFTGSSLAAAVEQITEM